MIKDPNTAQLDDDLATPETSAVTRQVTLNCMFVNTCIARSSFIVQLPIESNLKMFFFY